jgi:hypothetical protein
MIACENDSHGISIRLHYVIRRECVDCPSSEFQEEGREDVAGLSQPTGAVTDAVSRCEFWTVPLVTFALTKSPLCKVYSLVSSSVDIFAGSFLYISASTSMVSSRARSLSSAHSSSLAMRLHSSSSILIFVRFNCALKS